MRNMSFAFTTRQILDQTKTVTRRLGWKFLKVGDLVQPVEKGMGLKKGERVKKIGLPIRVILIDREHLYCAGDRSSDIRREGFPHMTPDQFTDMFCKHNKCLLTNYVTRIEFEYTEEPDAEK